MSWLISGTGGFWRKCREDDSPNFRMIRAVSGGGASWVETLFLAPVDAIEDNFEIECTSLVQEIAGGLRSIGDGGTFDMVLPGLTEDVVEVLRRVEEQLPGVPSNIFLVGRKRFQLRRTEWPLMLKFINYYLPAPATLADFASPAPAQLAPVLDDPRDEVSGLAAAILYHAVRNDIDAMHVWENHPSIEANDFWTTLVPERGPPIFRGRLPSNMHELFARGVVLLLAGKREQGLEALKVAHQVGHPTARRWLEAHGIDAITLPAEASALLFRRPPKTRDELQKEYTPRLRPRSPEENSGQCKCCSQSCERRLSPRHTLVRTSPLGWHPLRPASANERKCLPGSSSR